MDAIIVGAGIIGSSIAWRLAQRGVRVTLVDQGIVGGEASFAGAGMLAPGGEYSHDSRWAKFAVESLAEYPDFVRELQEASGVKIDFRICGALEFARTEQEWDQLSAKAERQLQLGIPSEVEPVGDHPGWYGVRHYPKDAVVDPRDVLKALDVVLRGMRVNIVERHRVEALNATRRCVDAGQFHADVAVLAAGAWNSEIKLTPEVVLPASEPVKGHLLGYQLEAGSLGPILRHGHAYVLQRKSGYTIAGSTTERCGFDRTIDARAGKEIARAAIQLFPALAQAPQPDLWSGLRPGIQSGEPQVGRIGDLPVWASYGHYRNGILLAPRNARLIAEEIMAS